VTETSSLRDWDETWNLRDRHSQNWASRRFLRPRPSLENPSLLSSSYVIFFHWQHNWHFTDNLMHMLCLVFAFRYLMQLYNQARRQDFPARGPKTTRRVHFLNTILDVCSNRGPNMKWGEHIWNEVPGTPGPLLATTLCRMSIQSCYFCVLVVECCDFECVKRGIHTVSFLPVF